MDIIIIFGGGGGVISIYFRAFFAKFQKKNFVYLIFLILFLGVNSRCWVHAYVSRKIESTPPTPMKYALNIVFILK